MPVVGLQYTNSKQHTILKYDKKQKMIFVGALGYLVRTCFLVGLPMRKVVGGRWMRNRL